MRKANGMAKKYLYHVLCAVIMFSFILFITACSTQSNKDNPKPNKSTENKNDEYNKKNNKEDNKRPSNEDDNVTPSMKDIVINIAMTLDVQENNYYCGPAALKTILRHFGITKNQDEIAKELGTHPVTGSEYVDLTRVLNYYIFDNEEPAMNEGGYHVQTLALHSQETTAKNTWLSRLRKNIDDGYPSVLAVNLHYLYPELGTANHIVICTGYIADGETGEIKQFYILDPYYGVQDATSGGLKVFTPEELWLAQVENDEPAYIW